MRDTIANNQERYIYLSSELRYLNLTLVEQTILSYIKSVQIFYGGYQTINEIINISRATYKRTIKELERHKYIKKLPYQKGKTPKNSYVYSVGQNAPHNNNIFNYGGQNEPNDKTKGVKMSQAKAQNELLGGQNELLTAQNEPHNNNITKIKNKLETKSESARVGAHAHTQEIHQLFNNLGKELQDTFNNYIEHIQQLNHKLTNTSIELLLKKINQSLKTYKEQHLITLINEMIAENHKTIYFDRLEKIKDYDISVDFNELIQTRSISADLYNSYLLMGFTEEEAREKIIESYKETIKSEKQKK